MKALVAVALAMSALAGLALASDVPVSFPRTL